MTTPNSVAVESNRIRPVRPGSLTLRILIVAALLLAVGAVIFRGCIFGEQTLLYKDIGSDSINISYPYYVLLSDYIREIGVPSWSFRVGMGQNLFPFIGTVVVTPVIWLAKELIAPALVYQHLLYLVIAGTLFARFLLLRGLDFTAATLGALLLAFSAYMCMGSCWYFHASEVVCFSFLLFAAEKAVSTGRWLFLTLAVALIGLFSSFYLYLGAAFLSFYVPLRVIERHPWNARLLLRTCLSLAIAALFGVGLTAIVSTANFYNLLNSPRGSGAKDLVGAFSTQPIFGLESTLHYVTAALRPFGNDMLGTGSHFFGWQNYLEAPMTYCGLVCLLLLPQVFVGAKTRKQILYAVFLLLILVPTIFPWFRYLFWAFHGNYYRTLGLFWVFGIITLSVTVFARYAAGRKLNLWVLLASAIVLIAFLFFPHPKIQSVINPHLKVVAAALLFIYAVLLAVGQLTRKQNIVTWIIGLFVLAELVYFDHITVATRPVVTKAELKERIGYNDETIEAVRAIKADDHNFFRITKIFSSGLSSYDSINDAMVFGYYGTSSYSSFNDLNYIKFLVAVDAITFSEHQVDDPTQWSKGLTGRPLLSTFACEKYVLTEDPNPFQNPDYYESVRQHGKVHTFRNRLALPLGLTFGGYISESMFYQFPAEAKGTVLLLAAVLPDDTDARQLGLTQLTFEQLRERVEGTTFPDTVAALRTTALNIIFFSETRFEGTIRLKEKRVLVLQMPFDPGWHALQDGHSVPIRKIDIGLLGVPLDSGEHIVQLRYRQPLLIHGTAISLTALLLVLLCFWRWPRLRQMDGTSPA